MELRQYIQIVWKWLWLIVLGTLLAGGVSYWVSSLLPPVYRVSTSLLVKAGGEIGNDYSTVMASEHLAATYKELLTSRSNLERTAKDLGLDPLRTKELLTTKKAEAWLIPNTSLIRLTVEDSDPYLAVEIANGIVSAFMQASRELGEARGKDLVVVEPARQPLEPVAPRKLLNTLVAAVVGFALATGAAFLIEYLDDTLETAEDIQSLSLPALAVIPRPSGQQKRSETPIAIAYPGSSMTEAYRALRTRVQFSHDGTLRTLLITSPLSREEKVHVVANLGVVMAQAGLKVLLVDADLRQPSLHQAFGLAEEPGLSTLLSGDGSCQEYITETDIPNLRLLPGGSPPPDPLGLLGSQQMVRLIEELKTQADVVLFNTPPILVVADAMVLASRVDGTMLVVESRSTRREAAMQALEMLHNMEAKVIGVALNKVRE